MKHLKVIALIILILFANISKSQQNTFKKISFNGITAPFSFNILCKPFHNEHSFFVIESGRAIIKIDSLGNRYYSRYFTQAIGGNNNFLLLNDSEFVLLTGDKCFIKFDTSLNMLSSVKYDNMGWFSNPNIFDQSIDKGFIFCGNNTMPIIIKTDSNGFVKWSKQYNNNYGGIQQIIQTHDSEYVLALNIESAGACIAKTDSVGNILWCKSYFRPRGYIHSMVKNSDGSLTIVGSLDSIRNNYIDSYTSPLFLMKVDPLGNIIWAKTFGDLTTTFRMFPSCLKLTQDGGYIIATTIARPQYNDDVLLIKTDANGDTLWIRAHGTPSTKEISSSIEQLNDKGYILAGATNNLYNNGSTYIVRTDSLGHTASKCFEYCPSIPVNNIFSTDSNIVITSIPYTITTSIPNINTAIDTNSFYDGCGYYVNIAPFEIKKFSNPPYPNPTSDVVKFKISKLPDYSKENFITVYDSMGKIILQKAFTTEEEQQVDLIKYGKGIYLIKINEGANVSSSKVVVD